MESVFSHSLHAMCSAWIRATTKKTKFVSRNTDPIICSLVVFVCFCVDIYENDIIFTSCIRFACSYNEWKQNTTIYAF